MYNDYGRALSHGGQPRITLTKSLAARGPAGRLTRFCGKYPRPHDAKRHKTQHGKKPFLPHPHHLPPLEFTQGYKRWANRLYMQQRPSGFIISAALYFVNSCRLSGRLLHNQNPHTLPARLRVRQLFHYPVLRPLLAANGHAACFKTVYGLFRPPWRIPFAPPGFFRPLRRTFSRPPG